MGFSEPGGGGGGHEGPITTLCYCSDDHKFGTDIKLDVFYTMVRKKFVMSLRLRNYDVITCILPDT